MIDELAVMVKEQLDVVLSHGAAFPDPAVQPVKVEPLSAVALIPMVAPLAYGPAQGPNAPLFTLQDTDPFPTMEVVSVAGGAPLNVAVIVESLDGVKVQLPVPVQPVALPVPLQPAKPVPSGCNVIELALVNANEQVVGQLIPPGKEVTVPVPLPASVTVTAEKFCWR